jgi:serine phosphatase RsbU (regulator of sigma subunit)/predicted transcriptional regulator
MVIMKDTVHALITSAPMVRGDIRVSEVVEQFRANNDLEILVVIESNEKVCGIVGRGPILAAVSTSVMAALWERRPIEKLMETDFPVITPDISPERALLALVRPDGKMHSSLIAFEEGQFCGIVRPMDVMKAVADRASENAAVLAVSEARVKEALKQLTDSVDYASRLQKNLLPSDAALLSALPDVAVRWRPRDVVSGDIYLASEVEAGVLIGVIDCTGHGVPGSLMTMVANAAMTQALGSFGSIPDATPADILTEADRIARRYLNQHVPDPATDDGFDAALCLVNKKSGEVLFAGAKLSAIVVPRDGEPVRVQGASTSLAYPTKGEPVPLENIRLDIGEGGSVVLVTDGVFDQIGENVRRSFGYARMIRAMAEGGPADCSELLSRLEAALLAHQGEEERRDDVTMLAFRPF